MLQVKSVTCKTLGEGDRRAVGQRDKGSPSTGSRMWDREKLSVGLRMERGQERFSCQVFLQHADHYESVFQKC